MGQYILIILAITSLMTGKKALAQADISMSTHWYNRANYNPASIARTEYIYVFSNIRQQWLGVDGAPKVFNLQVSEYLNDMNSAFGLSLTGEKVGLSQVCNPMLSYAYRIANDPKWSFSMGLSCGVFARVVNGSLFEAVNVTDPAISYELQKKISPDANLGFEFQSEHYIFGFSSTHLLALNKSDVTFLNTNHRYLYLLYKNENPEMINYHTSLQMVNRNNLTILEGNVSIRFKRVTGLIGGPRELFDIGMTYRTSRQVTLLFGLNISPDMRIGYAYDTSTSTGYLQNGSHEIMVEFRILSRASSTKRQCERMNYWYH
jgi:type IX secretion system PorP/SprF family membrane protein